MKSYRGFSFGTALLFVCASLGWSLTAYGQEDKKEDKEKKEDKGKTPASSDKTPPAPPTPPPAGTPPAGTPPGTPPPGTPTGTPPAGSPEQAAAQAPQAVPQDKHRFQIVTTEEKTNSLKEKIFRSKAQLMLLQETLLQGAISTARVTVVHKNEMGSSFLMRSASYILNGNPIYTGTESNSDLNKKRNFQVFANTLQPRQYTLTLDVLFQGNGFGVFSYLNKYRFRVRSSYTFKAQEGKLVEITIVFFEKNRFTTQLNDRPSVRYEVNLREITAKKNLQKRAEQTSPANPK